MVEFIIESMNIRPPTKEIFSGREVFTGICKKPVPGPVCLTKLGFEGDGVADTKHHGGEDKALCVYSLDHYPYWEKTLGTSLPPAAFGENLTVLNIRENDICIGDVFQLGTAIVQVSQPRQPCKTLAARYNRRDMIKLVVDSGRTGFYCRVLQEGSVDLHGHLVLQERDTNSVTIAHANHIYHHDRKNGEGIDAVLSLSPLSASWRESFRKLKERLT